MNPTRFLPLLLTALVLFAPNARAAFSAIGVGSSANDGTGDTLRAAFVKVNDNFDLAVLNSAGSATNLTIVGGSFSAITNTTLTASKPVFSAADKSLTSTGTVPVDQGGTGLTAWTLNGIPYASATGTLASGTGLTFDGTTLTVDANLTFTGPQTIATSSGALTLAAASGSSLLVNLATTGDFIVNTDDLVVDTSSGNVGIGNVAPETTLHVGAAATASAAASSDIFAKGSINTESNLRAVDSTGLIVSQISHNGTFAVFETSYFGGSPSSGIKFGITTAGVNATALTILSSGEIGIGTTSPSAALALNGGAHIGGDSDPGDNNLAVDGTVSIGGGTAIASILSASAALDFASTSAQNSTDLTITVTGAADGDTVSIGVPNAAVAANTCFTGWVSAANTVTVRFNNYSSGAVDPTSATFRATVTRF